MIDHYASRRGEGRADSKLTNADVAEIRRRRGKRKGKRTDPAHKDSIASMAREFGVSVSTISNIANGHIWRHVKCGNFKQGQEMGHEPN